jgi:hypothetical protein
MLVNRLSAAELLEAWEQASTEPLVQRALTLLRAACPETTREALAGLSIGRRDAYLLSLRKQIFGPELSALSVCPNCGERVELLFAVDDVCPLLCSDVNACGEAFSVFRADHTVSFRLPNSLDLLAIAGSNDLASARKQLLQRCLLTAEQGGESKSTDQLSPEVLILSRMCDWILPARFAPIAGKTCLTHSPFVGARSMPGRCGRFVRFTRSPRHTAGRKARSWP